LESTGKERTYETIKQMPFDGRRLFLAALYGLWRPSSGCRTNYDRRGSADQQRHKHIHTAASRCNCPTTIPTLTPSPTAIRDQRWGGAWNCKRSSGEPCITQTGSGVDGTWGIAGTLHGQISGDSQTLGGTWAYRQQNGTFVVALASDGQSWFGIMQPDNRFWCGWRDGPPMPAVCAGQPPS
jgi:hypothetical protein